MRSALQRLAELEQLVHASPDDKALVTWCCVARARVCVRVLARGRLCVPACVRACAVCVSVCMPVLCVCVPVLCVCVCLCCVCVRACL